MCRRVQLILGLSLCLVAAGCGKKNDPSATTDNSETAQQIGDAMASIDESSGSSNGAIAFNGVYQELHGAERLFARIESSSQRSLVSTSQSLISSALERWNELLLSKAEAVSCLVAPGFGSCTSNTIVRDFNGCTIGASTLTGTVTLTWGGGAASCSISGNNQTITRVPAFTISGRRGGTLTVSKSGSVGQTLTRTASGVFNFTNDGIRRVIAYNGTTLFDFTTDVTGSGLTVSGAGRSARTLSSSGSAALRVTNNSSGQVCSFVPTNVTWSSTCTCATSGSWAATCSDGKSATLEITGCGSASFTMDGSTESMTFDRCYGS